MITKTLKKRLFAALIVLGLLASGGYGGYRWYRVLRQTHLVNQARQFLAASDRKNALLCLERALLHNSKDLKACRLMADLADSAHSPAALVWRERVVEYNPGSVDDRLSLAETAIRMHDYRTAESALDAIGQSDRNTAGYHNIAGTLALATQQPSLAKAHFQEVARLEPTNILPQLNLAVLRLHDTNAAEVAEGRSFLRNLASNPTNAALRLKALRELTAGAMRSHQTNAALSFSLELSRQTNATFADQLLRLDALANTGDTEFKPALAAMQRQAASDPVTRCLRLSPVGHLYSLLGQEKSALKLD